MACAIISSMDSCISDVSAEIVTAAQPLVGMLWLMVRIFAPEPAKIERTLDNTPGLLWLGALVARCWGGHPASVGSFRVYTFSEGSAVHSV